MSALKLRHGFVVFEHDGKEIALGAVEKNGDGAWCFWPCESTGLGSWSQCQLRWIADRLWDLNEAVFDESDEAV